jgi:hypothetical protein
MGCFYLRNDSSIFKSGYRPGNLIRITGGTLDKTASSFKKWKLSQQLNMTFSQEISCAISEQTPFIDD